MDEVPPKPMQDGTQLVVPPLRLRDDFVVVEPLAGGAIVLVVPDVSAGVELVVNPMVEFIELVVGPNPKGFFEFGAGNVAVDNGVGIVIGDNVQ
jgi:hypothetical protein